MFERFKYIRSLKRQNAMYMNELLEKACYLVDGFPDIVELAKRAKDMNITEVQKMFVEEIVKYIKTNEENKKEDVTAETQPPKSEDNVSKEA